MQTALPAAHRKEAAGPGQTLTRVLYENGLSIALLSTFLALWWAQSFTGWKTYNHEQHDRGEAAVSFRGYLTTGHFVEATGEQLSTKGSPEAKGAGDESEEVDREPDPNRPGAPWPVRKGGIWLAIYSRSLTLAFLFMFAVSFLLHAAGGAREFSHEQLARGQAGVTILQFMGTSEFWFQSMQNWQSEFLAIAAMVILSIWLRQKGSPESKPVDARHSENE